MLKGLRKKAKSFQRFSTGKKDDGNKTVGMGDHLPQFIALSFDQRRAS